MRKGTTFCAYMQTIKQKSVIRQRFLRYARGRGDFWGFFWKIRKIRSAKAIQEDQEREGYTGCRDSIPTQWTKYSPL